MNLSKLVGTATAVLVAILCSFSTANATTNNSVAHQAPSFSIEKIAKKVEGGPRDVVQNMAGITIFQEEPTNLFFTVVKPSGEILLELTSSELQTTISTEAWDAGEYTIETNDEQDVYQEFTITIE